MSRETLSMTTRELDRLHIVQQCLEKRITQRHAAKTLDITEQHVKRLINRYKQFGPAGLVSQSRGKPSNRRYKDELRQTAIDLIKRDFYDYGPTLAAEKLYEYHNIKISKETAREWMLEAHIW